MTDFTKSLDPKQDDRPFYKKKSVLIPVGLLLLGIIGSQMDKDKKASATSSSTPATIGQTSPSGTASSTNGGMDLKTKITNNIKSIDGGDDLTKSPMTTATDFQITAALFKAYAMTVNEGKASSDKEVLKLTTELEKKVVASQRKNFPKIRKAYYEFVKNKLWENDVYVDISGAGNTIIKFTGGYFAANKNIKETQEALSEMLILLRFKQTQYRWYKGQDEFTYYTIDSSKDSEVVE